MRAHPVLAPLAIVLAGTLVGFGGAALGHSVAGAGAIVTSVVAAVPVLLLFAFRPVDGLAAFGIAVLLSQSVTHWTGADLRYLDEVALVGLLATAVAVHRRRIDAPRVGAAEIGLTLLVAAGIASSAVEGVPPAIAASGLALLLKGFAFFYLTAALRVGADDLRRLSATLLAVVVAIAAIGLVQLLAPTFAAEALRLPSTGRQRAGIELVGSVFTHPALFGWLTAYVSLFLYARFAVLQTWWALVLALLLNAGTLVSGRRAPIVGVVAGLVVGALRQATAGRARLRRWAVVGAAVLVLLVASVPLLGDFYRTTLDRYGAPPAVLAEVFADEPDARIVRDLQPRVALYAGSLAVARDHFPLGAGIGRYASHTSREVYSPVYEEYGLHRVWGLRRSNPNAVTDTFWPMILGETGVVGLAGALLFFGAVGARLWQAAGATAGADRELRVFALGALLVAAETLVRSLVSPVFVAPPIAYFAFGAVGLALSGDRGRRRAAGAGPEG